MPKSQSDKFKDLARELETDESEERFDRALKKVAKASKPQRPSNGAPAMSVNDYDEQLYENVQDCIAEGYLDEEGDRDAIGVARQVIHESYDRLTPKQKVLYDAVVVPALRKLHELHERIRVDNTD